MISASSGVGAKKDRNQKHLQDLAEKRFEDNILKEVEFKRFHEAKRRLRNFLIHTDMSDVEEKNRLLSYFSHRYVTLIAIVKESVRSKRLMKSNKAGTVAPEDAVNTEITKRFSLKNKHISDAMDNNDPEASAIEAQKQLKAYKKMHNLPDETKIYKVLGTYPVMRDAMNQRGWIEHDWVMVGDKNSDFFLSQAFDFLYALRAKDVYRLPLAPNQFANHIFGQNAITTKVGLTHNMKNLVWKHNMDIGRVFP